MKKFVICFLIVFLGISYVNANLLSVSAAFIKRISGNTYLIEVIGTVPTPGYTNIQIVPNQYLTPPVNWEMSLVGEPPTGIVIQVLTPIGASLEYTFPEETKEITIKGKDQSITLSLTEAQKITGAKEVLYGIKVTKESVIFLVLSNGCTERSNFVCQVDGRCKTPAVTLYRIKEDTCKKKPTIIEIEFSKEKLNLNKAPAFTVTNSFCGRDLIPD